jgi:uncharacterized protein (UPF0276 family)
LGVGITYSSAIEPLLERYLPLVDVLEIEPQTTWLHVPGHVQPYRPSEQVLDHLAALPVRKLVHSVGTPVGGTIRPEPAQLTLLRRTIAQLGAPWASDHLSFNATPEFKTGFFLPPRQTAESVLAIAASISDLKAGLGVPIAVETGVNYLRPRSDEMGDGQFVRAVVEEADCGLLLDLHNAFANALNGRQALDDFLANLPLERVWEVHVAGGMEMDGFWLDAHSGAIPESLVRAMRQLLPRLPHLRAIIFEVFPAFVPRVGIETLRGQLEILHELWTYRGVPESAPRAHRPLSSPVTILASARAAPAQVMEEETCVGDAGLTQQAWEQALGSLVVGRVGDEQPGQELAQDPGVALVIKLVNEFRASMLVNVLRLTIRFLILALGEAVLRALLADFWARTPPQQFATTEAEAFATYLENLDLQVPKLAGVLAYERAVLATIMDGTAHSVIFESDPIPLLRALAEGRLPEVDSQPGRFEIEVTPDGPQLGAELDATLAHQVFPFH